MTGVIAIQNTVQRYFEAVDDREWSLARSMMHDPFYLDYSSFGAGPGSDMAPDVIIRNWAVFLPGFEFTHHQLGPLLVEIDGDRGSVRAYVTASHFIADAPGGQLWTVVGVYDIGVVRIRGEWRLSALTFEFKFQEGNTGLPSLARERVAS